MKTKFRFVTVLAAAAAAIIMHGNSAAQQAGSAGLPSTINCDQAQPVICAQVGSVIYYGKFTKN